jgi:hypothetical protein
MIGKNCEKIARKRPKKEKKKKTMKMMRNG